MPSKKRSSGGKKKHTKDSPSDSGSDASGSDVESTAPPSEVGEHADHHPKKKSKGKSKSKGSNKASKPKKAAIEKKTSFSPAKESKTPSSSKSSKGSGSSGKKKGKGGSKKAKSLKGKGAVHPPPPLPHEPESATHIPVAPVKSKKSEISKAKSQHLEPEVPQRNSHHVDPERSKATVPTVQESKPKASASKAKEVVEIKPKDAEHTHHHHHHHKQEEHSNESDHSGAATDEESGTTASTHADSENSALPPEAVPPVDPTEVEVDHGEEPTELLHHIASATDSEASNFSTTELTVTNLPLDTTMGHLHLLFPQAIGMRLGVSRDKYYDSGYKTAWIEFESKYHARRAYYKNRHTYVKGVKLEFLFHALPQQEKLREAYVEQEQEEEEEEEEQEEPRIRPDPIPVEKVDKQDMIRKWINFQKAVANERKLNSEKELRSRELMSQRRKKTK